MVGPGWHLQMSLLFDISRTEFLGWQLSCSAFSTMGESFGRDSSQKPVTSFSAFPPPRTSLGVQLSVVACCGGETHPVPSRAPWCWQVAQATHRCPLASPKASMPADMAPHI